MSTGPEHPVVDLGEALRGLSSLREATKLRRLARSFLITLVKDLHVSVTPDGRRTITIFVSKDETAVLNSQQKIRIQNALKVHPEQDEFARAVEHAGEHRYKCAVPWRWASAGYLPILVIDGVRYVALFLRDIWPFGWNLANGASSDLQELLHPERLAEREGKEELIVVNTLTGLSYCLSIRGGDVVSYRHHQNIFRRLRLPYKVGTEPIIGRFVENQLDTFLVYSDWEHTLHPFVSPLAFGIFNGADGEGGVEYIQAVEWIIPASLLDLKIFNGEVHERANLETGKISGMPILQPAGLFRLDRLMLEFQKPRPVPVPDIVFDHGTPLIGDKMFEWMVNHPYALEWCPVTCKVLRRYFQHVAGSVNAFAFKPGGICTITFEGKTIDLKTSVGLKYLRVILEHPNVALPAEQVVDLALGEVLPGDSQYNNMSAAELAVENLFVSSTQQKEPTGLGEYKSRLRTLTRQIDHLKSELEKARDQNDTEYIAELERALDLKREESEELEAALAVASAGKKGEKGSSLTSTDELARQRVSQGLHRIFDKVRVHHPSLYKHFTQHIHGGREFIYTPPNHVRWQVPGDMR